MGRLLLRAAAHKAARHTLKKHVGAGGVLDLRHGFALLRDRRVALAHKLLALGIGFGLTVFLLILETPVELMFSLLIPFIGLPLDLLGDGIELLVLPWLFASMILPRLVRNTVQARVTSPRR